LTVSAVNLKNLLEHGVSASGPGLTPGQFPQVGGLWVAYDLEGVPIQFDGNGAVLVPGTRIRHLGVTDPTGAITDLLVADGMMVGDPERPLRIVTLDWRVHGSRCRRSLALVDGNSSPTTLLAATSAITACGWHPEEGRESTSLPA
jgi:hypothetical protein